jgi:phospholipase C
MATGRRINHVVILMLENRSFDHYFGFSKPAPGQKCENLLGPNSNLFNLLDPSRPKSSSNPSFQVKKPAPFAVHDKDGPSHSFNSVCVQLCNNKSGPSATFPVKNNGFVRNYRDTLLGHMPNVPKDVIAEVMTSFAPEQLPAMNKLAQEFCLCDHWFCEVPGPTMPNRMYIHAATSEGYARNAFDRPFTSKTVYELFEEAKLTWTTYFHDFNEVLQFKALKTTPDHFRRFEERWNKDIANGDLANYSFILPRFLNETATKRCQL